MAFIVNQTFFVREIDIPNKNSEPALSKVNLYIAKYEPDCLLRIFGYPLYKLWGVESSTRMDDLLNGADYTDGENVLRRWQGLKHDTDISLIANYIFFYHLRDETVRNTGVGTVTPKKEQAASISPAQKMADAWNFFSKEVYEMSCFLWLKKDGSGARIYPEFSYNQYIETRRIARKIDPVFSF